MKVLLSRKWSWIAVASIAAMSTGTAPAQQILTLDEAERIALEHNRGIAQAAIAVRGADDAIRAAKTQRLPSIELSSTTGMLLTRPTMTFEKGAFGDYPGIGPVPGDTANISSARKPTAMLSGSVALPLTQQKRIGYGIRIQELSKQLASQEVRLARQNVVKQVRQTYYAILQAQSSIESVDQTIALLRELSSQTTQYVKAGTALSGDLMDVKARLAQSEYDRAALAGPLATNKERLNLYLGRPIETEFQVAPSVEASWVPDLSEARNRAAALRPEIEQARIKIEQAEVDRKKKKAEGIPDVSLSLTYFSALNISSGLPRNVAIAGVQTSWDPFDWGKRKSELAQKDKSIQDAQLALRELEDKVRIEVGSAHRKMHEARLMLSASRASQESARESVRLASVRFRRDAALLKDVLEAQAGVAAADERTQRALASYWSARAELEMAIGEER